MNFIKTAEHIIEILSLSGKPMILVLITKGAPNTTGVVIFNQYAAISWKQ